MEENIIVGIVYTEIDDLLGPNPIFWLPSDLPKKALVNISIKTVTLLTAEKGLIPKSLSFIPFPSLEMKGIIKYIEYADETRRGKIYNSAITILFKEFDDLIFYKYMTNLESIFNDTAQKIIKLGESKATKEKIAEEIKNLQSNISIILEDLRIKEVNEPSLEPFPEVKSIPTSMKEYIAKIIVCGDPNVGKTSIILRYTRNAFKRTYLPSIGVNICEKTLNVYKSSVKLVLWDIAGQNKFQIMRKYFYAGADGFILVFDLTDNNTFHNIEKWSQDIKKYLVNADDKVGFIIANKNDLTDKRSVNKKNILKLAKKLNLEYIETSALTGQNIELAFKKIADIFIKSENN